MTDSRTESALQTGPGAADTDLDPTGVAIIRTTGTVGQTSPSLSPLANPLSDLTPLIDSEGGKRMVIGRDLNIGTQYVDPSPTEPHRWGPMHRATMARLESFGFSEQLSAMVPEGRGPIDRCPCGPAPDCRHVQTLRWDDKPDGVPWQNDSMWTTRAVTARTCAPVDDAAAWALSDHCPVLAELEFPMASPGQLEA